MTLIEEYYELNEAEEVSAIWKVLQIIFYVFAGCVGLWCGYTMALLRIKFDNNCYLFTTIKVENSVDGSIDTDSINWGSDVMCDYCQYSMVSSFIVATIWATFFLMCGKGGKSLTGLPQPWRIVWPSFIFNFIYFLISLTTAINIQGGTDTFCNPLHQGRKTYSLTENCKAIKLLLHKNAYTTALQIEIVTKTSWACAMAWLILFLISFFRIIFVIDFHMYKICVFKIDDTMHNKREEVLRITNYEEPKRLHNRFEKKFDYPEFEEQLEEVEERKKKKNKPEKSTGHQFHPTSRSLLQPNAAFYITADLRMLSRKKKRTEPSKSLDETYKKNNSLLEIELKKPNKVRSQLDDSTSTGLSQFLYRYPKDFDNDEDGGSNHSMTEEAGLGSNHSETEIEIFTGNVEMQESLSFKKQI